MVWLVGVGNFKRTCSQSALRSRSIYFGITVPKLKKKEDYGYTFPTTATSGNSCFSFCVFHDNKHGVLYKNNFSINLISLLFLLLTDKSNFERTCVYILRGNEEFVIISYFKKES